MDDRTGHNDADAAADAAEGVRIIGAEEAAEAVERGDVAPRLSDREPRFGDRPSPPQGARPALRFPLDADTDISEVTRPPVLPTRLPGDDPTPSSQVELPPWTDPPTGEVPAVLVDTDESEEDLDAWSSFATSSPTRWRDRDDDWDDDDFSAALASDDDRMGALDTDRPSDEDLFSFDDVDEIVEQRAARRAARAVAADPGFDEAMAHSVDPTVVDLADPEPVQIGSGATRLASSAEDGGLPGRGSGSRPPRRRSRPEPSGDDDSGGGGRDVPTAVAAGVTLAVVALVLFALGAAFAALLATVVVAMCGVEYFGAVQRAGSRPAALLGIVATAAFPLAVYWRGEAAIPLMLVLAVVFSLLWYLAGAGGDGPAVEGIGVTLVGVAWIGMLGSFATLFLRGPDGRGIVLAIILVTVAYDIGGFFMGRTFGQRPLSAASPNKTIEGLLGGAFVSVVVGMFVGGFGLGLPFHGWGHGLLLGLVAAVAAPLGDLCESVVKRDLGIKDMGAVIPGHGGVLDRVDGLLFVLPAVYYFVLAMHWM